MMRTIIGTVLALVAFMPRVAQAQTEQVFYYHTDAIGSVRMITDETGQMVARYDYLPFGEVCDLLCENEPAPDQRRQFAGKERDQETGLDYFGARYYASQTGRLTSPDPISFQVEMLGDPQRFSRYSYTRNNPLRFVDPKGEAIELLGDEDEREKALAALRSAVGARAGTYLYEKREKDGKYYVGIYSNGPDGKGPAFDRLNDTAASFATLINATSVVTLGLASQGTVLSDDFGGKYEIGSLGSSSKASPGWTIQYGGGKVGSFILDPSTHPGFAPPFWMRPMIAATIDQGILAAHELGHAGVDLGLFSGDSLQRALDLENTVRRNRNPNAPIRVIH
jgi:RHS repeat-associated protein